MGRLMARTVAGFYTKSWNGVTMNMDEGPSTQLTFSVQLEGPLLIIHHFHIFWKHVSHNNSVYIIHATDTQYKRSHQIN